jgi:hypothetical protein
MRRHGRVAQDKCGDTTIGKNMKGKMKIILRKSKPIDSNTGACNDKADPATTM